MFVLRQAYERRFPTCDMIPILANTEKVTEEKSEDGAEHVVERKCSLHVDVPYLLKKVSALELSADQCLFIDFGMFPRS